VGYTPKRGRRSEKREVVLSALAWGTCAEGCGQRKKDRLCAAKGEAGEKLKYAFGSQAEWG